MPKPPDPALTDALTWFRAHGLTPKQPTPHQLKLGQVNYYYVRGTIFIDGEDESRPERGLNALKIVLVELKYLNLLISPPAPPGYPPYKPSTGFQRRESHSTAIAEHGIEPTDKPIP